jgi:hypothetical protein
MAKLVDALASGASDCEVMEVRVFFWVCLFFLERWPSGLRRTLGKRVYVSDITRVRIPLSPFSNFSSYFSIENFH